MTLNKPHLGCIVAAIAVHSNKIKRLNRRTQMTKFIAGRKSVNKPLKRLDAAVTHVMGLDGFKALDFAAFDFPIEDCDAYAARHHVNERFVRLFNRNYRLLALTS